MEAADDLKQGLDVLFIVVSTIFVLMMQTGFALYEMGTIHRTRPAHMLLKNIVDVSVAILCWLVIGHSLSGQGRKGFIGWRRFFLNGAVADRVSFPVCIVYAFVTCLFSYPILAHWAWAEDGWASPAKAPINHCGVLDFAGSFVVHVFGGTSSFVWALFLGERKGRFFRVGQYEENRPVGKVEALNFSEEDGFAAQDRPKQALGMFFMWLGRYGFNCGATLSVSSALAREIVALSAVNPTISPGIAFRSSHCLRLDNWTSNSSCPPAVCSLTSMVLELAYHRKVLGVYQLFVMRNKFDVKNSPQKEPMDLHQAAFNGILAGLVTTTAGVATTHPHATVPIAVFGAVVYHLSYRYQYNLGIDNAVNAAPVHMFFGIWGTIAASLCYSIKFRNSYFELMETRGSGIDQGGENHCGRGGQLLANLAFTAVAVVWAATTSFATLSAIDCLVPEHMKKDDEQPEQATQDTIETKIMIVRQQHTDDSSRPQQPILDAIAP